MANSLDPRRRLVANAEIPASVPVKPQGSIAVIARVVWADGLEEWRPARAIRWTATHVMVAWLEDDQNPRSERYEWLRAGDVTRTVSWFVAPPHPVASVSRAAGASEGESSAKAFPVTPQQ